MLIIPAPWITIKYVHKFLAYVSSQVRLLYTYCMLVSIANNNIHENVLNDVILKKVFPCTSSNYETRINLTMSHIIAKVM